MINVSHVQGAGLSPGMTVSMGSPIGAISQLNASPLGFIDPAAARLASLLGYPSSINGEL